MEKHFVIFCSPGTLFSETTEKPIDSWDIKKATKMADKITERYGATPYGFYFTTRSRKDDELDSKVVKRSGMYFLGGIKLSLRDVINREDPTDKILISNMKNNNIEYVIENCNSWKVTQPFDPKKDKLLDYTPKGK